MSALPTAAATRCKTQPLSASAGVEVLGFKFSATPDEGEMREIRALADRHLILLFRDQQVSETAHVAFSQALGPVIPPVEKAFTSPTNPLILHLGNVDAQGNKLATDDPGTMFTYAPEKWHSDGSYKPIPNYLTMLHALEIPPEGGETWFASMVAAYEALPASTKALIADKKMEHPYPNSGKQVKGWQGTRIDVVQHSMVRHLPDGQKALFVSPFGGQVLGMDKEASDALVKELLAFATSGAFTYKHQWRLGDTLVWNNRGLVHQAQTWDRVKHRRLLQRTEVSDVHGYTRQ
jgi:alpha-ketoglutarate-dependent taurine dioxygenase